MGGINLVAGAKHLVVEMLSNNRLPSLVAKSKLEGGWNLVTTASAVFHCDEFCELIQYRAAKGMPTTASSRTPPAPARCWTWRRPKPGTPMPRSRTR